MNQRKFKIFVLQFLVFILVFSAAIWCQNQIIRRRRGEYNPYRDTLYLPDSRYVQAVTMGYDQFAADFLWLRMIQSYAAGWSRPENAEQMQHYFNVISDLDPQFVNAYSFNILAVGEQARQDQMVIDTTKKALVNMPNQYSIPYQGAFYAFWSMNDPDVAKFFVRMAQKDPNCPEYVDRWEGYIEMKSGRFQAAYDKYLREYLRAISDKSTQLYDILHSQLIRAVNEWFISEIKQRAIKWETEKGMTPTIQDLESAGRFKDIEMPDWPAVKKMLDDIQVNEQQVLLDQAEMERLIKSTIKSWDHLPVGPYELTKPGYPGFIIWPGEPSTSEKYVLSRTQAIVKAQEFVGIVLASIAQYININQHPPKILADLEGGDPTKSTKEPFGGEWIYKPETGEFYSSTYPDLLKMETPQNM